jgi:cation/acetate symporter
MSARSSNRTFFDQLAKYYAIYTGGFVAFVIVLAIAEQLGLSRTAIGYAFLFATIALYATIGIISRTKDVAEYYVAGRRVPAFFNGMATGADWMSAASFIGMAGGLYLQGFDGLAFIMGWTGGYCLVAFLLAPYLRKFGQFTIPDFLGARYGGHAARTIGIFAAILCSFTYVVAQIYGVGIITSRFTGVEFNIGVFLGLGGILVCSFLGGMRAVTWTQVAQYIILIVAYMIPVVWLAVKHTGVPIPQAVYGKVLERVTARETELINDPGEIAVRNIYKQRAAEAKQRVDGLPGTWDESKVATDPKYPKSAADAKKAWSAQVTSSTAKSAPPIRHGQPFYTAQTDPVKREAEQNTKRRNFLALIFCLMLGTAALPHILMRYYTTPSVTEARRSVFWSLFFIFLLYFTAPALAVLVKFDIYTLLVGTAFGDLATAAPWVDAWNKVDPALLTVADINGDGIVQLAEISLGQDIVVLATPAIAGMPYVISGLVAAGGLAAALSTADGLLLTIANALSHDLYYKMINPNATTQRRVLISKTLLLFVALLAAYVASQKPADILFLVSAAFSFAAASFFPALVFGVFWKRANKWGAVSGMVVGLGVCFYYMATTQPWLRGVFGVTSPIADNLWWGIQPISAATFGVPAGILALVVVSLITPPPDVATQELVEHVRYPNLRGERMAPTAGADTAH